MIETLKTIAAAMGWLLLLFVELGALVVFICACFGVEVKRKRGGDST